MRRPKLPRMTSQRAVWTAIAVISSLLLILPPTGWIADRQSRILFESPRALQGLLADLGAISPLAVPEKRWTAGTLKGAASRHPGDFIIQLGCALANDNARDRVQALNTLTARFPGRASLDAAILRNAAGFDIKLSRDDNTVESVIAGRPITDPSLRPAASAATLAAFVATASDGERLDPNNAFFPMMRAIGLYESHQDRASMTELAHAASLPIWNDYIADETRALWIMDQAEFGGRGAIDRTLVQSRVLESHLAILRAFARVCTARAIQAEQAGRGQEGLTIRRSVMRCGALMRAQSTTDYGVLLGAVMPAIAMGRPGGAPAIVFPAGISPGKKVAMRTAAYVAYLKRIGHPKDAAWAVQEFASDSVCKAVIGKDANFLFDGGGAISLMISWIAGAILLANALWFLALGGISAIFDRAGRDGKTLPAPAGWIVSLLLVGASLYALFEAGGSVALWSEVLAGVYGLLKNLSGQEAAYIPAVVVDVLPYITIMALPCLASLFVVLAGILSRTPPFGPMARILPGVGLLFLLGYAGSVAALAVQDSQYNQKLDRSLTGEAQYAAQRAGKPWPAAQPLP